MKEITLLQKNEIVHSLKSDNFLKKRSKLLKIFLLGFVLLFSVNMMAQNDPIVIKDWTALEEATFHYDVSYQVVKCSSTSNAMVLINSFNENGTHPKVGFTFTITDAANNTAQVVIAPFTSSLGDMRIASCSSNEYSYLKFDVPNNIDASTMKMTITYNIGS